MIAVYLGNFAAEQRRRNHQSWESLVGRLHHAWHAGGPGSGAAIATGWRNLWAAYRDAGLIMQMADVVERDSGSPDTSLEPSFDPSFLKAIRADAIQVRLAVLKAVACLRSTR